MMNVFPGRLLLEKVLLVLLVLALAFPSMVVAQSGGSLRGQVSDPSGAVVPGAAVTLTQGSIVLNGQSGNDGVYLFKAVPSGSYTLTVQAEGFATFSKPGIVIAAGQARQLNVALAIAVQQQDITVNDQSTGVSVNPDENSSALVVKGSDLDALSDDPDELQNELQALAGPSAGPSGGQIYIDGFTGGQIPPKSSIREIRVNQNPFSAEFDKIGYGRIEILTKPGSDKFSGHVTSLGNDSAWNTANPLVQQQPSYYLYFIQADVNGPLTKNASYFFSLFRFDRQNQSIIDAVNPQDTIHDLQRSSAQPIVSPVRQSSRRLPTRQEQYAVGPRLIFAFRGNGEWSWSAQPAGTGIQPEQSGKCHPGQRHGRGKPAHDQRNPFPMASRPQQSGRLLLHSHGYRQGAFTTGGSNSGVAQDHQDIFELQNYSTATAGSHTIRFGARLRAYRDANYSTAGSNGNYLFTSIDQYLAQTPAQYQATVIKNPLARALLFDGALFYQDDWRTKPNLTLSYGLRFETQNRIHDHADFGPRFSLAWAPGHVGKTPPKTVVRAGYGWFYDRFTVPNSFSSSTGTPYIMQAIHQNGINQQSYVINNPDFYDPNAAAPPSTLADAAASIPSFYNIDPHFHAALSMQGGVGVDQQISKKVMFNVTYLFTRGVHQYLTNNVTAPEFDPSTYTVVGPLPAAYNYQFQSGGIYKQHQVIVTANTQFRHLSLHGSYTFNEAKSDTQGVNYVPSVAQDPGLDYGRAGFGIRNRLFLLGTYSAPHGIIFAPAVGGAVRNAL